MLRLKKNLFSVGAFCFSAPLLAAETAKERAAAPVKPNVVFILTDDLGYGDLSCYGQQKLQTPNIDRLAKEGIKFTNYYSGSTVCSPSRASLMTGQHTGHTWCRGNSGKASEDILALDPQMITMPRLFKNAGYATGAFGKWGLGHTNVQGAANPLTHGFDTFSGWKNQMIAHTYYPTSIVRDGKEIPLKEGTYIHDLIMADAFKFIKQNAAQKQPVFCYLPTAIPHAAMHAPKALHDKWRQRLPQFDKKIGKYGAGEGELCPPVQNPVAGFAAMMEHLDNQVGELLAMLQQLGIDKNTLIIFASDNGTHSEGGHDPHFWRSNGGLRGIKRSLHDGGIRSPLLVRWPGTAPAGIVSSHISAAWDFVPTFAALTAQATPAQSVASNSISMLPTIMGQPGGQKEHRYLYWEHRHKNPDRALRMGKWKAVQMWAHQSKGKPRQLRKMQLFDLSQDPREQHNIAAKHPEIMAQVLAYMKEAHRPPAQKYQPVKAVVPKMKPAAAKRAAAVEPAAATNISELEAILSNY